MIIFSSIRHVLTAAHCICEGSSITTSSSTTTKSTTTSAVQCLGKNQNQIQKKKNTIVVAGGSKLIAELDRSDWHLRWDIDYAYIRNEDFNIHDIGILELGSKQTPFFDRSRLLIDTELQNAEIVPICLGALNLGLKIDKDTKIKQLGWGRAYEEFPLKEDTGGIKNPEYSSCMTTQASHDTWRFQNCDMKHLKRPGKNIWECEKKHGPPDYEKGKVKRCNEYFEKANKAMDPANPGKTFSQTRLKEKDFIYVVNVENGKVKTEKCFNPTLLSNFGWCFLADFREKHDTNYAMQKNWKGGDAWGICSPSCDTKYTNVSGFKAT